MLLIAIFSLDVWNFIFVPLLIAVIGASGVFLAPLVHAKYLDKLQSDKRKKYNDMRILNFSYSIDAILAEVKGKVNADRIALIRYHNGGSYSDGVPFRYFSLTNELISPNCGKSQMKLYQKIDLTLYREEFKELMLHGIIYLDDASKANLEVLDDFETLTVPVHSMYQILCKDYDNTPIYAMYFMYHKNPYKLSDEELAFAILKLEEIKRRRDEIFSKPNIFGSPINKIFN